MQRNADYRLAGGNATDRKALAGARAAGWGRLRGGERTDFVKPRRVRPEFTRAALTLVAVIASFCTMFALCRIAGALPGPAILSAILAMSLGRRENATDRKHLATAPLAIAFATFASFAVGALLVKVPIAGAIAFVAGIFLSIYLRNFGENVRRIGTLIAMPLVGILVAPGRADAPGGIGVDLLLFIASGILALAFVTLVQWVARRAGRAPIVASPAVASRTIAPGGTGLAGMTPTTRLALQMAVALAAAFAIGFLIFPNHWGWSVLTAFIVASGARGRGDVLYKSLLRLGGAIAGTLGAALIVRVWLPSGPAEAAVIFAVLFAGFAFRNVNYSYWALCMTLVLALLSRPAGPPDVSFLVIRLEAILAGALCSVAAAWFVFPIKTTALIRKRLSDALLAFDDFVTNAHAPHEVRAEKLDAFEKRVADLELVAAPVRFHRSVFARNDTGMHPASWIDQARRLHDRAPLVDPEKVQHVRRAIGLSRRAIGNHGKAGTSPDALTVGQALQNLHETFGPAE